MRIATQEIAGFSLFAGICIQYDIDVLEILDALISFQLVLKTHLILHSQ